MAINDAIRLANFASNVGTGVTLAGNDMWVAGIITATSFAGDGSNITNAGSSLSAASGSQRVVVTSLTSGTMTSAGTDADLTFNSTTNTLSAGIVSATTLSGSISGTAATFTGNITGTAATFTGNVSIAGTLTYEDVTNIDSVGVITAKSGIRVGSGESISPVSGTFTYYGDGSNLTGVEAGFANFVASGAIPNGATVVINDDGTVGIITQTTSSTPTAGTPVVFESGTTAEASVVYDPDTGKVVISYCDDSNGGYGTAVVGTISGDTISFGTPVVFESANIGGSGVNAVYDSTNDKVVIAYRDGGNSSYGTAIVGTVSGTSISFGSAAVFVSDTFEKGSATFDSTNGKAVIVWRDGSNPNYGKSVVGTVSGTSISFGTVATFVSAYTGPTATTFDSTNGKVVIVYSDAGDSGKGKAVVGTVSGTSISFGTVAEFESGSAEDLAATFDSTNGKVVLVYKDDNNSAYGTAIVATVSGTDISFGTPVVYNSGNSSSNSIAYDSVNERVVISYQDQGNSSYGTVIVGTVSGTSISFGSEVVFESATTNHIGSAYDSTNEKVVIAYQDAGNSNYGTSVVFSAMPKTTNLTTENYIGIAGEAIANGATGKINIDGGVNSGQSGLTTAKTYYVAPTGILTTTAATPSVVTGTSISDTKIIVWL